MALGRKALPIQTDITKEEQVDRMVQKAIDEFGKIDILVNSAAATFGTHGILVRDLSLAEWQLVLKLNLTGAFFCSRTVLKHMMA